MAKNKPKKKGVDPNAEFEQCGELTQKGTPCRRRAYANGKCDKHGGRTLRPRSKRREPKKVRRAKGPSLPGETPNWSATRGLYFDGLFPDEELTYDAIEIGTLEAEIKLLKIQLKRAVIAQLMWSKEREKVNELLDQDPEILPEELRKHLELSLYDRSFGTNQDGKEYDSRKMVRRCRDYMDEIRTLVKLIATLEGTHKTLTAEASMTGAETIDLIANKLRDFANESLKMMPFGEENDGNGTT